MKIIPAGLILVLMVGYLAVYVLNKAGFELGSLQNQRPETANSQPPSQYGPEASLKDKDMEQAVLTEVNQQRRKHGLRDLIWHEEIANVARRHSLNMGTRRFFSHTDPVDGDLKSRMEKAHLVHWRRCGENILMESFRPEPVRSAVEGWMNSPGHRQNILNPAFTHTGIGVVVGGDNLLYFTQAFILPG